MRELVVISGKGGTGKTSLVGSFAALAGSAVLADCDVDASDLPIILRPTVRESHPFSQGHHASISEERCVGCGACHKVCRFDAIAGNGPANAWSPRTFRVDPLACEGCGACVQVCPREAIILEPALAGEWFVSDTRFGPLVHARLAPGGQNSGKLVSMVKQRAHEIALATSAEMIIVDGSPGIGCPVIASLARASLVLIVTEPTPSGRHDMERVIALAGHFKVPALLCVNRWDLNPEQALVVEHAAARSNVASVGRVRVDSIFGAAQRAGKTVVEMGPSGAGDDIHKVWSSILAVAQCRPTPNLAEP